MKESKPKIHQTALTFSLLALAISTGTLQADTIKFSPTTIALACNSNSGSAGPGAAQTVNVRPVTALTGSNTILVTAPTLAGVTFSPATQTLAVADNTTGKNFTLVSNDATCATPAATQNIKFKVGASPADDPAVLIVTKSTNPASNLTVPATITLLCGFDGTTRTTGDSQTVMVTSTPSGEGFAPVTTAGLTLGGGGTTPSTFTVKPVCDATYAATQNSTATYTVPLRHSANTTAMNDKNVTVTVKTVPLSKLTVNLLPAALTYVKGSSAPAFKDITVSTSAASTFMTVDTSTLPIWLTVDTTSATIMLGTPKGIRLSTTSVADTMAPGSYSGSVHLKVSGQADQYFPVTLQVNNPAGKLTISEGQTRNDTWTVGSATLPTYYVTMVSSGSAIPYSVDLAGPLQPQVDPNLRKGLAYSFGTKIPVTFKSDVFAAAQAGTTLSGTVSITWGNPSSTTVVTFNITIQSPGSTLISITPAAVPTALPGTSVTLYLTGTGFIASLDPNVQTRVGTWVGNAFVAHSSLSTKVNTPSSITLTITVPAATDTVLPFKDGGIANLAVCNPTTSALGVTTCTAGAGANASFTIGSSPNIQTITSASTFSQVGLGVTQNVAPFDMLSIFGFNFCPSCSSSQVLPGVPDTTSLRYPNFVTPDATAPAKKLQVGFYTKGTTTLVGYAPLLFASNTQINLVVPGALTPGTQYDIIVTVGTTNSLPATVSVVATNPGIFTIGADGQGDGAILDSRYAVVGANNPAAARKVSTTSDTIAIYMTGLGVPDSDGTGTGGQWDASCATTAGYISNKTIVLANAGIGNSHLDGQVMLSSWLPSPFIFVPCFLSAPATNPTVKIGDVTAVVKYSGWVGDSIAGLYQVNAQLPATIAGGLKDMNGDALPSNKITKPVQLPVVVTANGIDSQPGVSVWVAPRLDVQPPAAPGNANLRRKVNVAWPSSNNKVTVSDCSSVGACTFMVTEGVLPSGLTFTSSDGSIAGTPAAFTGGPYPVTVTATDTGVNPPITGSVSFIITIDPGLVVSASSGNGIYTAAPSTQVANVFTAVVAGGSGSYTYALSGAGSGSASGISVGPTGIVSLDGSKATNNGPLSVTLTVTDTADTSVTGTYTFTINIS